MAVVVIVTALHCRQMPFGNPGVSGWASKAAETVRAGKRHAPGFPQRPPGPGVLAATFLCSQLKTRPPRPVLGPEDSVCVEGFASSLYVTHVQRSVKNGQE